MNVDLFKKQCDDADWSSTLAATELIESVKRKMIWADMEKVEMLTGMTEKDLSEKMPVSDLVKLVNAMGCKIKVIE